MPNIINPNCLSLPQQVEKNRQDILKILASNLEELTGLQFIPNNIVYQNQNAILNGKFIVIRDDSEVEIDGVVNIPIFGDNGVIVDAGSENLKIRIALDQSDRDLFNYVQELVNRTTESDEIVFTSDMENFVSEALENVEQVEVIYDNSSSDININWGYTGGIYNGISVSGRDFSKYKKLRCLYGGTFSSIIEIDLNKAFDNVYVASNVHYANLDGALGNFWGKVQVNADKNTLTFNGGLRTSAGTSDTYAWLYKIEGVF